MFCWLPSAATILVPFAPSRGPTICNTQKLNTLDASSTVARICTLSAIHVWEIVLRPACMYPIRQVGGRRIRSPDYLCRSLCVTCTLLTVAVSFQVKSDPEGSAVSFKKWKNFFLQKRVDVLLRLSIRIVTGIDGTILSCWIKTACVPLHSDYGNLIKPWCCV